MWEPLSERFVPIRESELALLSSSLRADAAHVSEVLAEDFVEIGRSGRRWTREEMVASLAAEAPRATPETSEWLFDEVGPSLILVTYVVHGRDQDSRHSSLWETPGPILRFHQGTVVPRGLHRP